MRKANGAALVLALIAALACAPGDRGAEEAATRQRDTMRAPDSAPAVGDSVMVRDTTP